MNVIDSVVDSDDVVLTMSIYNVIIHVIGNYYYIDKENWTNQRSIINLH